jgi:hypothetical protein
MKKESVVFLSLLVVGIALRFAAVNQLDWFFGLGLHVDEITYVEGDSPPFERPPGTYLMAGLSENTGMLRVIFSTLSLVPGVALFFFRKRSTGNALLAGAMAVEPTLAFSGLQVLPAAPAAALLSIAVISGKKYPLLTGWFIGCAALFRGEVLLFVPVSLFFLRPFRKYLLTAGGILAAVVPVSALNFASGGQFAPGGNGPLNMWIGSSWDLLETPPGLEFEQLMGDNSFTDNVVTALTEDFPGWVGRGFQKAAAFFQIPGPGRNIEAPRLILSTVLTLFLPVTLLFLAFGVSGFRKNTATALIVTGILAAFLFFPSVRHRSIFLPAFAFSVPYFRRRTALVSALLIITLSLFYSYPGSVRPGLTEVLVAEKQLGNGSFELAFENLRKAEEQGYTGADIHSVRGACIASSGGGFHDALTEFGLALEIAPESPTAWKNIAAVLWNYGYREDAIEAAEKAVSLNPALRNELSPILSSGVR